MCLTALMDWPTLLWWIDVVLKVAFGLGFVIFVHELGHFLVAKACGVKIEKFMIGFDIGGIKLSRRHGETEYGIGILPLGGYVKMLGQDDDPARIAEQMQKSQVNEQSADAVPITGPHGETYYVDRRSYLAKSVPQRIAIISAGVVMNVIFAFIFAVIAYGLGVPYLPSIVSGTVPGSPAWEKGLEAGDEIVQLGERENPTFMQLKGSVTLADLENGIPCVIRRASDGELVDLVLTPTQDLGRLATIGISGPQSTTLLEPLPVIRGSSADRARLVRGEVKKEDARFKSGDTIIRIGEEEIASYREYSQQLAAQPDETLLVTVRRGAEETTQRGTRSAKAQAEAPIELTFELAPQPFRHVGLVMKMGPITAVRRDSPGAEAGLLEGDVIEQVDGQAITGVAPDGKGWNPATLPNYLVRAAQEGRDVELQVRRAASSGGEPATETIRVEPQVPRQLSADIPPGASMGADAIGIAYEIGNEVSAVVAAGPPLDVQPGDRVTSARIVLPVDPNRRGPEPEAIQLGPDDPNWPALVDALQSAPPGTLVELKIESSEEAEARVVKLELEAVEGLHVPARGMLFEPITRVRKATTFAQQLRYGWDETSDSLLMVFRFLKKLGTQVPITALGGPVTIARAAGYSASEGLSTLLIFLTMLSANLAVINFMPIPLLDGGHIVFLLYEGIRGKPANEKFVVALHTAGFVLIVGLMLYVLALDVGVIDRGL